MPKITMFSFDDWIGIYLDGKLVYEQHSVDAWDLLDILKIPYKYHYVDNYDVLEESGGRCPDNIENLLRAINEKEEGFFSD